VGRFSESIKAATHAEVKPLTQDPTGRREHKRIPATIKVRYSTAGGFLVSYSLNLSKGGMFIETPSPLAEGTPLSIQLEIPGTDALCTIEGTVMWTRSEPDDNNLPGMGVAFSQLDEKVGHLIDNLVAGFPGIHILLVRGKSTTSRSKYGGRLRNLLTCRVTEVGGTISAIDELAEDVDLVVADLDRAGREGLSLLHWIQERAANRVPVVAIATSPELQQDALRLGADQILTAKSSPVDFRTGVLDALARPLIEESKKDESE
jgi:uncharacterized protein (TIGR02266 family)